MSFHAILLHSTSNFHTLHPILRWSCLNGGLGLRLIHFFCTISYCKQGFSFFMNFTIHIFLPPPRNVSLRLQLLSSWPLLLRFASYWSYWPPAGETFTVFERIRTWLKDFLPYHHAWWLGHPCQNLIKHLSVSSYPFPWPHPQTCHLPELPSLRCFNITFPAPKHLYADAGLLPSFLSGILLIDCASFPI